MKQFQVSFIKIVLITFNFNAIIITNNSVCSLYIALCQEAARKARRHTTQYSEPRCRETATLVAHAGPHYPSNESTSWEDLYLPRSFTSSVIPAFMLQSSNSEDRFWKDQQVLPHLLNTANVKRALSIEWEDHSMTRNAGRLQIFVSPIIASTYSRRTTAIRKVEKLWKV